MVVNGEHEKISIGRVLVSGSTPLSAPDMMHLERELVVIWWCLCVFNRRASMASGKENENETSIVMHRGSKYR